MKKRVNQVILISLILNLILTAIKLSFGYVGGSHALVSDGYNSLSDVFVSIVLVIFLHIAHKEPDENHPYGHEKYEALVYFMLGMMLILTAGLIGFDGIKNLVRYMNDEVGFVKPSLYTVFVAGIAIVIKVFLFILNRQAAKKFHSPSLKADALNHLFDIFSTSAALISIVLAQIGLLYFEFIASIIIALIIIKSSLSILKEAIAFLVDEAPSLEVIEAITETALKVNGVLRIDDIKVRRHMSQYYVDMEIAVKKELSLKMAHDISEDVHDTIEDVFKVIHCMVHVNPID